MLHLLNCFLFSLHQLLFSTTKHSIKKQKQKHPSPQEISKSKPDTMLMLNSEQYILARLLRIHVRSFGYSQQFTRSVTLIMQIPFLELMDNIRKGTFMAHSALLSSCSHFCLNSALLNDQTHLWGAWLMKEGAFWTIDKFLCIQKAGLPLEPQIREDSFTSVF